MKGKYLITTDNWFVAPDGSEENHIIIAGCQIHYAVKCDKPHSSDIEDYTVDNATGIHKFTRPTRIYIIE
jgi:hypothetical protein